MRKVGYVLLVLVALGIAVGGCGVKRMKAASIEGTFKKITPGMDVEQVMKILAPTTPDLFAGINQNGENRLRWLEPDGSRAVQAIVVFENGKVVTTQWIGPVEPPTPKPVD